MLRITTEKEPKQVTLKLEGELAGTWVSDFLLAWRKCRRILDGRALLVDLSSVVRIDKSGEYLLALVHCHGAQLTGSGIAVRHLIHTIGLEWPRTQSQLSKEA